MTDSFAVHLGGGAYLDASGKIVFGTPTGAQIYQAPGGFRLDPKKLQDTFKDLSNILPHSEEDKKKWMEWGVPKNIVNFLAKISGVAGIVGTAVATYMWAVGVLMTIMDLMTADDGMSPELGRALTGFKSQMQGNEQIQRADRMIQMHADFDGRIDRVRRLLIQLVIEKPIGAARAQIFAGMRDIVDELAVPLSNLRDQEWATTYDIDAYKGRAFASMLLVFERSDGSLAPVPMQSPNVTVFDYRLGVPMLLFGATTFTALIQIAMPWFRSAGMYAEQLRKTADAIDRFVLRMQDESISRTEYTPTTVLQQQVWPLVEIPTTGAPAWNLGTYAVGAFDLVRYNDAFLWERYVAQFQAGEETGQRGLFNYHWSRPGAPPYDPSPNLGDVAAAANEQVRQDYANLQVATGMLRLISTAAWLRFLSTPPDRSQTVSGFAGDSRIFRDEAPTIAKSPSISPVGVIEHAATLKRYDARDRVRITTQEPGYVPAFRYRIVLRTINSLFGMEGWYNRDYAGDIWRADYEPTQGDPRCKRLHTELRQNSILSEVVLYEGPSPIQTVTRDGRATLRATTFDWYVPVVSPWSPYTDVGTKKLAAQFASGGGQKTMLGTGGVSIHLMGDQAMEPPVSMHLVGDPAPLVATTAEEYLDLGDLITLHDASLDKAERRHVQIKDVVVAWQLTWIADKLEVRLFGRPEDRPFQAHVVVEETVYSGETTPDSIGDILSDQQLLEKIHTPFVAEMVNQLVFVPEEFFRKEREAIVESAKMWREFLRRFAEQAPIGPGDPIEFLQESIRELATRSSSTATLATTFDMRVEFAMRQAPELWNAVLREAQRKTAAS
jgi:hypothetical protein